MFDLKNKTILVTGASGGIGQAIAIQCSELGASVIITGRDVDKLNLTLKLLKGKNHNSIAADLKLESDIEKLVDQCPEINGLVHAAGIIYPLPVKFIKEKHIQEVFSINYNAAVLLSSSILKKSKLQKQSSVVFISSVSSKHPYFGGSLYVSSKAALDAFALSLALELSPHLTRVNSLSPGLVKTKILEQTLAASELSKAESYEKNYPFGFGETEDISGITAFLLSDRARWITGQNIVLDGGLTLVGGA